LAVLGIKKIALLSHLALVWSLAVDLHHWQLETNINKSFKHAQDGSHAKIRTKALLFGQPLTS